MFQGRWRDDPQKFCAWLVEVCMKMNEQHESKAKYEEASEKLRKLTGLLEDMSGTNKLQFLTENDWVRLRAKAEHLTFRLGEVIVQEGSVGDAIYLIRFNS
jgi:hypothetical protein